MLVLEGFSRDSESVEVFQGLNRLWSLKMEEKKWRVCEMNGLVLEQ